MKMKCRRKVAEKKIQNHYHKKETADFQTSFRRYIDIFFSDLNINVKNTYYDIQFALHHLSMTGVTSSN